MLAYRPKLNKSYSYGSFYLVLLIFLISFCVVNCFINSHAQIKENDDFEIVLVPESPSVGDAVQVKIKTTSEEKETPKVFFDRSKLPVFLIQGDWYRTFIPLSGNFKPGVYPLEIFFHGKHKKIDLIVKETKFPVEELTLTKEVAALRASRIEKALVAKALSTKSEKKLWGGKFTYPSLAPKSTIYGVKRRVNGVISPDYFHKGVDFRAKQGSNILAPENGAVVLTGYQSMNFVVNGNCIFIDHGHGVVSGYLHLSEILVKEGALVKKGQIIGKVGSTGIASGPHLHWGVYVLGKTVDPLFWTSMTIE